MVHTSSAIYAPEVDWSQIMVDLHNAGCTSYRVARTLGIAYCTAQNWTKGGEPGYGYGRAVLRLHSRWCGAGHTTYRLLQGEKQA